MCTIRQALQRIKGDLHCWVPQAMVQRLADEFELGQRRRLLTPVVTAFLFLRQILHGNTACSHLRHLSGLDFSDAAYCRARARLPFSFFKRLQQAVTQEGLDASASWRGHDVYLIDGSSFSMPDTAELQQEFGQPTGQLPGCGFPVAHLLLAAHAGTGYIREALPAPCYTHDMAQVPMLHPELPANALLVGDRAFCSYAHLALCQQRGLQAVFRAHQKLIVDFRSRRPYARLRDSKAPRGWPRSRWHRRLGTDDQLVEYFKPRSRPAWMTPEQYATLPESMFLRELRYRIRQPGRRTQIITLVTTLLDPHRYPAQAVANLYGLRWEIEGHLRHLKQTLGMDVLRCQTFVGVMKELAMFVTVYNLVRRVMHEAARRQNVPASRISFIDALRWLCHARIGDALPPLRVVPQRPGRAEPRIRKRRPKQYPLMRKARPLLRQALFEQDNAA